jgi:two-component system, LytTR family, response regulator
VKIKCLAIDDEPLALEIITDYISKVSYLELVKSFDNALDSIEFLKKNQVDLIFLDIQMEALTGIQFLHVLKERPHIIFTTAYDSYALEGYELDAVDYLLKPFSLERFIKAVEKVYTKMNQSEKREEPRELIIKTNPNDFLFVKTENRLQKVFFHDILFVEGQGDYLRINTPKSRIMTLQKFSRLQDILPDEQFFRVHKSWLVAIDKIDSISRNRIRIGDTYIPISESYRKAFFALLDNKKLG